MIRTTVKIALACAAILTFAAQVCARDALFLGLTDKKGESVNPHIEQAIRHELSTNRRLRLIGETETQRVIREMERQNRNRTERFIPENAGLSDSTVIIRGIVEEMSESMGRSWLLWGKINMRMTLRFYFHELNGPARYDGDFSSEASMRKEFLLFKAAKKNVHISAPERLELTKKMQADVIKKFSEFATLFFKSLDTDKNREQSPNREQDQNQEREE